MKPLLFFLSSCVFGPAFSFQLQPSVGVGVTRNHGARRTILKTTQNDASLEDVLVSESASQSTTSNGITATLFPATRATPSSSQRPLSNRQQLDEQYPQFPRTWVPIASTLELDHTRPNRLEFLDQSYVAYRNPRTSNNDQQQWVVMDNTCPHRLAPLSEGRVEPETGRLQCSYHGWTFEADGSCQRIPQVVPSVEQSAMANPRSCLPSYSTMLDARTGVLWVWPWQQDPLEFVGDEWRHPEGFMEGLILDPSIQNATEAGIMTYTRDQPYGWDTLVENLIDPAHIPFAHHGMQGSRSDAIPINMTSATNLGEAGFAFEWQDRTMGMMRTGEGKFRAPFLVNYNATFASPTGEAKPFRLSALCIPTRPGWSRVMVFSIPTTSAAAKDNTSTNNRIKTFKLGPIMAQLFKRLPTWGSHLLSNKFFDSDLAFLHYQEQLRFDDESANSNLQRGDARYFMPAECDRSIVALHGWIGNYASSYVKRQSTKLPPAIYDRSILFDHFDQHTSKCKICSTALDKLQRRKRNSQIVLAASILLGLRFWPMRLLAVASLGTWRFWSQIEGKFYKGEFKHHQNH